MMRTTHAMKIPANLKGKLSIPLCLILFPLALIATTIHIDGPYDLDRDGYSELLLLLNKPGGPFLEYIEMEAEEGYHSLWDFTPPTHLSGRFTDAMLVDLDGDQVPELVATYLVFVNEESGDNPWLYIFKGDRQSFSSNPLVLRDRDLSLGRIRPSNLVHFHQDNVASLAVALGTPSRQIVVIELQLVPEEIQITNVVVLKSDLIYSGYGHVFTGMVKEGDNNRLIGFSTEANLLKAVVHDPAVHFKELIADVMVLNGARRLIGSGITAVDENGDGNEELLLPFQTGELFSLSFINGRLSLRPSTFAGKFLFTGSLETMEDDINKIFLTLRKEELAESVITEPLVEEIPVDTFAIADTIALGDTLMYYTIPDTAGEFYSFQWLTPPPAGTRFDPTRGTFTWVPTSEQVGIRPFTYLIETRVGEKVVSIADEIGDRHQIMPILEKTTNAFAVMVVDTTIPVISRVALEEFVSPPVELFSVMITTPDDRGTNRFIFDGVPPFGVMVHEIPNLPQAEEKLLGHHISANLAAITENKQVTFSYTSKETTTDVKSSVTLIHDLENNVMFLSVTPQLDTIPQSFHPEAWESDLYRYPEYFFEGFPSSMAMDSAQKSIRFTFDGRKRPRVFHSSIALVSPINPNHYLTLYLEDGELIEVRGEVKVKENGSKKIITEINFAGRFNPTLIVARLEDSDQDSLTEKRLLKTSRLLESPPVGRVEDTTDVGIAPPVEEALEDTIPAQPEGLIMGEDSDTTYFPVPAAQDVEGEDQLLPDGTHSPEIPVEGVLQEQDMMPETEAKPSDSITPPLRESGSAPSPPPESAPTLGQDKSSIP